jgi:hypothetical protein
MLPSSGDSLTCLIQTCSTPHQFTYLLIDLPTNEAYGTKEREDNIEDTKREDLNNVPKKAKIREVQVSKI